MARRRVVIVGGGFAGLETARRLAGADVEITLVDRRNHHLFQPLLYQVATAALNPADIAAPIRGLLSKQKNARVILAEAIGVDVEGHRLLLSDGELPYDELVLAAGVTQSYFGNDAWQPVAPGLKSLEEALEIRRRVLLAYEAAEREKDPARRRAWMTFVIVGAGPTGVELAGALIEIARHALAADFRTFEPSEARVVLVEGASRVLTTYSEVISKKARAQLQHLGVEVRTEARVSAVDALGVSIGEERIPARTVLWAAGIAGANIAKSLGVPLDRIGRVIVERDLTVPGHPEIHVIGDLAAFEQDGVQVFGVAPAALQAGKFTARYIRKRIAGQAIEPFRYVDKGSLSVIGRGSAVADLPFAKLSGFPAWLFWLFIHIMFLVGFRSKALVLFQWAWSFVTFQRGVRLITGVVPNLLPPPKT